MRALICMRSPVQARLLALALENLGEEWQASWTCDEGYGWARLAAGQTELAVLEAPTNGPASSLLEALKNAPPLPPPWTLCVGCRPDGTDAALPAHGDAAAWAAVAQELVRRPGLPCLCAPLLPCLTSLAGELLEELGLRPELRAAAFLPEMIAWCAAHPPMLASVTGRLYPCFAEKYGLRPGAVERDLRSALESLWSRGRLPALEKWFGHTVDPEKGRPTNREFLALAAEHVRRMGRQSRAYMR